MTTTDLTIQMTYLILTITVFSYLFSVVPFYRHLDGSTGEWYLMNALSIMALVTGIQIAIGKNTKRQGS